MARALYRRCLTVCIPVQSPRPTAITTPRLDFNECFMSIHLLASIISMSNVTTERPRVQFLSSAGISRKRKPELPPFYRRRFHHTYFRTTTVIVLTTNASGSGVREKRRNSATWLAISTSAISRTSHARPWSLWLVTRQADARASTY